MINLLASEIESIIDENLRSFAVEGLALTSAPYEKLELLANETRKMTKFARALCTTLEVDDRAMDLVTVACLLHGIGKYDEDGDLDLFHPFIVRRAMFSHQSTIGRETFEGLMTMIESYEGLNSVIPQVIPDVKDSVYFWIIPLAYGLTKNLE